MAAPPNSQRLSADDSKLLRTLIFNGNLSDVLVFMSEKGVSVNTCILTDEAEGTFPLHLSVDVQPDDYNSDLVQHLIAEGADCNLHDSINGYTPLHYAAIHNNVTATRLLLNAGADVNLPTNPPLPASTYWLCLYRAEELKSFPLNLALKPASEISYTFSPAYRLIGGRGHNPSPVEMASILISHGASCNFTDGSGNAPLHYAVRLNDIPLLRLLLDGGAHINMQPDDCDLDTPLSLSENVGLLNFLLSVHANREVRRSYSQNILDLSVAEDRTDITKYIVQDMPVLLHTKNASGMTPLLEVMEKYNKYCKHYRKSSPELESVIYLMVRAGCDLVSEVYRFKRWKTWEPHLMRIQGAKQLWNTLDEVASRPRPLFDLCTVRIRNILQRNVTTAVDSLPLPTHLKETITLAQYISNV